MADSRRSQLESELARREALQTELNNRQQQSHAKIDPVGGMEELLGTPGLKNPLNIVRDIGVGLGNAGQNLGGYMVENLEKKSPLFNKLRSMIPESARQEPINFEEYVGPKNPTLPDKLLQSASQYAPFGFAGGASIPGQIAASGAYGYSQTQPNEKNLGGLLPEGRGGGALKDMLLAGLTGRTGEEVLSGFPHTNPFKLTNKNIVKNVLKAEKESVNKFSGPTGKYETLSNKAKSRGITGQNINPDPLDVAILKKDMPEDEFQSITKLLNDKNSTNAQNAISQLGHRERKIIAKSKRGEILNDPEKDLLKAIQNTKNHIQENMFKDANGKVHQDLLKEHKEVQTGYRKEVIPYTKNKAIQEYKSGEKLEDQLVNSLMGGKFPAQRGKYHPPLMIRRSFKNHPILSAGTSLGMTSGIAALLYKALSGNKE